MNATLQSPKRMEWEYYTNPSKRRRIDRLLLDAANLFANCEKSEEARRLAQEKEKEILEQIAKLDRHFAAQCGWNQD